MLSLKVVKPKYILKSDIFFINHHTRQYRILYAILWFKNIIESRRLVSHTRTLTVLSVCDTCAGFKVNYDDLFNYRNTIPECIYFWYRRCVWNKAQINVDHAYFHTNNKMLWKSFIALHFVNSMMRIMEIELTTLLVGTHIIIITHLFIVEAIHVALICENWFVILNFLQSFTGRYTLIGHVV